MYPVACLFGEKDDVSSLRVDDVSRCKTMNITNGVDHYYQIVIWLNETGSEQLEQGKTFEGTVAVETAGDSATGTGTGGRVTGKE